MAIGALLLLMFGPTGVVQFQSTVPTDVSLWVPALIQTGGFGLLLWLYYSGKIGNKSDYDQRYNDQAAQYEARLKIVTAYSEKWEALANARDDQFSDLKAQLDTATKALALLAGEKKGNGA